MGMFFQAGQTMIRPGIYQRYENIGPTGVAGALNGIAAATYKSNWGPLGVVQIISSDMANTIGVSLGGGAKGTTRVVSELFVGGANTALAVRLGTGGTAGTLTLKDTTVSEAADAITITTKYPGSRSFKITIREKLGDSTSREFIVVEDAAVRETIVFPVSEDGEVDALIAEINARSAYFTAEKAGSYEGDGKLALIAEQAITPGTDPEVNTEDYSTAFDLLEPYRFNTLCVDSDDTAVHNLLAAYIDRVYQAGKIECFGVCGEPISVMFNDRCSHAAAFNDYNMVYIGGAFVDSTGYKYEGYMAAARVAGMVAATPSNQSLTHATVSGAVKQSEMLTNAQYEKAIKSGMIVFSTSADGTVWIESGITTLVNPTGEDDEGWKKIRRTKTRKELMARVNDTVDPLTGKINNDSDGQANVIRLAKEVCQTMYNEGKITNDYTVELDSANPPKGDSAWFRVSVDDIDSLEKGYFVYGFRYSPTE